MANEEIPVTVETPNSAFQTTGTDHITIWGSNAEETINYYRDVLGMSLVLRQPNLDDPSQTHLFFETGDGTILTFFVSDNRPSNRQPQRTDTGGVHHLCFNIEPERIEEVQDSLEAEGYSYNVFDRGIFYSLYTRDHDGLIVELSADKFDFPDERKGEVLATTQRIREEDGADYARTDHMRAALEEVGIEIKPYDLPDTESGAGGL
jgi:catechol 2,3-dioxygenase-like lactoylglutathione lyase family enzyme